jgi:hypothetical protein
MMKYSCPNETTNSDRKLPMNNDKIKRALLPHNMLSRILTAITWFCMVETNFHPRENAANPQ